MEKSKVVAIHIADAFKRYCDQYGVEGMHWRIFGSDNLQPYIPQWCDVSELHIWIGKDCHFFAKIDFADQTRRDIQILVGDDSGGKGATSELIGNIHIDLDKNQSDAETVEASTSIMGVSVAARRPVSDQRYCEGVAKAVYTLLNENDTMMYHIIEMARRWRRPHERL